MVVTLKFPLKTSIDDGNDVDESHMVLIMKISSSTKI